MTEYFPSARYACPCSDLTSAPAPTSSKRASIQPNAFQLSEDQALNPHSPRAAYALYPLDHLLYCDECDEIRCPRCWTEEILYWYCPSCLFEVPSSQVKSDGNRCSRSCYSCPSCSSPAQVTQIVLKDEGLLKPSDTTTNDEAYILQCHYCDWSSLEIDVQLSKPTKITEQLARLQKHRRTKEGRSTSKDHTSRHDESFASLMAFYKDQLGSTGDPQNPYSNSPYSSPANLARIMSMYGNGGSTLAALKKGREKPQPIREAMNEGEGLVLVASQSDQLDAIHSVQNLGWNATITLEQRLSAPVNHDAELLNELWPSAVQLRTRRAKRCKSCRHIISRPEPKVGSMRYKIRLLAMTYIPRLSVRNLHTGGPVTNPTFHLRSDPVIQKPLQAHKAQQYVLTVKNPLFEMIKISLATPATTPGKIASRVTILCPSFTVGPAGDVWDEALSASTQTTSDGGRQAAMASLTGSSESSERQPEAGKVWEKSRNSTSVIIEVVPGSLHPPSSIVPRTEQDRANDELDEDEDSLEIPIYVRAEWQVEAKPGDNVQGIRDANAVSGEKISKETGYWVVLAIGRIAE